MNARPRRSHSSLPQSDRIATLAPFAALGEHIESRWRRSHHDERVFSRIAVEALNKFRVAEDFSIENLVEWIANRASVPLQGDPTSEFGEPSITVYRGDEFHIDLLFWLDGTTDIHQHAFTGAFGVIHGSSIHSEYLFEPKQRACLELVFGEMSLRRCELLSRGDNREILPGTGLIHSLFHLDRPSVSVVVRTGMRSEFPIQYSYRYPFVAYYPNSASELLEKRRQLLDCLASFDATAYARAAEAFLRVGDIRTAFCVLTDVACLREAMIPPELTPRLLDVATKVHGDWAEKIMVVAQEQRRVSAIRECREKAWMPEHRFFLALLMNLRDRQSILNMIGERFETRDPVPMVLCWLQQMSDSESDNGKTLDIDFSEVPRRVVEGLLRNETLVQTLGRFEASGITFKRERQRDIEDVRNVFRSSLFFSTLFAAG